MAQLLITAASTAVGFALGGPTGARIGFALGSSLGGQFLASRQKIDGPRLGDAQVIRASYGEAIPVVYGARRVAPIVAWQSERRETAQTQGGKGSGPQQTSYTYQQDVLFLLTGNPKGALLRVWLNGKLVYSVLPDADPETIEASENSDLWSRITFYGGGPDQLPDPTYEAAVGVGNAPAYRDRSSVFIQRLQTGNSGQIPNLTFEVAETGQPILQDTVTGPTQAVFAPFSVGTAAASSSTTWLVPVGQFSSQGGTQVKVYQISLIANTSTEVGAYSIAFNVTSAVGNADHAISVWPLNQTLRGYVGIGGSPVVWTLPVALNGSQVRFCYRDGHMIVGHSLFSGGDRRLYRYAASGGTSPLATSPVLPDSVNAIEIIGDKVFAAAKTQESVFRMDLQTLALEETIPKPLDAGGWDRLIVINGFLALSTSARSRRVWVLLGSDWESIGAIPVGTFADTERSPSVGVVGSLLLSGFVNSTGRIYATFVTPIVSGILLENLRTIVEAECARAGMPAGTYDASALDAITKPVRSLLIGQVGSARATLEVLRAAYFFEAQLSDKLYFVPLATAPLLTIPYADLAAGQEQAQEQALAITQASELELPAQVVVRYTNISDDYQDGAESSDRLLGGQLAQQVTEVPLGMLPAEAKALSDAYVVDSVAALTTGTISVPMSYARLQPGDVVAVQARDGATLPIRLLRKSDERGVLAFDWRLHDASAVVSAGVTDGSYTPSGTVVVPSDTELLSLDIPLLRDADDGPGYYVAAKPVGASWPGGVVFSSVNDADFTEVARVQEAAVFGVTTTVLPDFAGGFVRDTVSRVTVNLGRGELASATWDALFADSQLNVLLVGDEIVRFSTATLVSTAPNVYTVSNLLRGLQGTEGATSTHAVGERVALLRPQGLRRVSRQQAEVGAPRWLKGVTAGRALSSATSQPFTLQGVSQRPLAPVDFRAVRAGVGGIVRITWRRRSRLSAPLFGTLPLGEASEQYRIRLYNGNTVYRTEVVAASTWDYPTAAQSADGTAFSAALEIEISQISATVGAGTPGRSIVPVLQGPSLVGSVAGVLENPAVSQEAAGVLLISAGDSQLIYTSADGGETFTATAFEGVAGYRGQRAALGDVAVSYEHNMAAGRLYQASIVDVSPAALPALYQNDRNDTNATTSGIVPRINSTNQGLYTVALSSDGTKFYLIAYPVQSGTLEPGGAATLYESTAGLNYTAVGAVAVDSADPNPGEAGTTEFVRQLTTGNPFTPLLRKIGSRWFLLGVEATYYTDASAPQTGWRRCVVTDAPRVQFRGIADAGGGTYLAYGGTWNGFAQTGAVYKSTNSGQSWVVVPPATQSDQMQTFQQPLLESHVVASGTLRAWLGDYGTSAAPAPLVVQCASPYTAYTLQPAVFTGSGAPREILDSRLTSTGYVATASLTDLVTRQQLRAPWLVWTADGINFQDAEIL